VKLDGCGAQEDLQKWADLISATGKSILIENCHWGYTVPSEDGWCPFNMYRTSGDIRSNFDFVLSNLLTTVRFNQNKLSYPGCWAYPDMLEVGCKDGPNKEDSGLTLTEARTHFGAWCIVSSPLVLSHDLTDAAITDEIWPIITNTEAIAINQAWVGDAGSLFKSSRRMIQLDVETEGSNPRFPNVTLPVYDQAGSWQLWSKALSATSAAVLLMNNDVHSQKVRVNFDDIPAFGHMPLPLESDQSFQLRDVWARADLGSFSGSYTAELASHDSAFLVVSIAY
jgi:alpha-galactosidase